VDLPELALHFQFLGCPFTSHSLTALPDICYRSCVRGFSDILGRFKLNKTVIVSATLLVGAATFSVASTEPGIAAQKPSLAQQLAAKPTPMPLNLDAKPAGVAKGNTSSSLNATARPAVTGNRTVQNKQAVTGTTSSQKAAIVSHDSGGIVSHDSGGIVSHDSGGMRK
jgi:hypothetical protein